MAFKDLKSVLKNNDKMNSAAINNIGENSTVIGTLKCSITHSKYSSVAECGLFTSFALFKRYTGRLVGFYFSLQLLLLQGSTLYLQ